MSRGMLIALLAGAFTAASGSPPRSIERLAGPAFSTAAQAATNLNSSRSNRLKAARKRGARGEAGLAVSDPGAEGSKPVKPKTK